MPHYTYPITPQGPLISVFVGVSAPRKAALIQAGQPVPQPIAAQLLVDTGASGTSIDKLIIGQLGMQPTGSIQIHTPSTGTTPITCAVYDVELRLDGHAGQHIPTLPVVESDFSGQGLHGLLGRDFLQYGHMTYCGHSAVFYISF